VGVLTPAAFASTPFYLQDWALEIRADGVTFASFRLSQEVTLLREQLSDPSPVSPAYVIWS